MKKLAFWSDTSKVIQAVYIVYYDAFVLPMNPAVSGFLKFNEQ
jgi:hypothetical protein